MVAHTHRPSPYKVDLEEQKFKVTLSFTVRQGHPLLKVLMCMALEPRWLVVELISLWILAAVLRQPSSTCLKGASAVLTPMSD